MRYPDFLQKNGVIGYVAPSFGCADEARRICFDHARETFRRAGYREKVGPNCYLGEGIGISSTPENCGRELTEGYCDAESDVLISCGGGELMCETISHVDFEAIRHAKPKWYMGYSDNTNMTFLLTTLCDTASVYGPGAKSFGMSQWHPSLKDAFALLRGEKLEVSGYDRFQLERNPQEELDPLAGYLPLEERVHRLWLPGGAFDGGGTWIRDCRQWSGSRVMQGRLIGGCMDCLVNLLGTRFDRVKEFAERYHEDGFLWFLEACDLNVFSIRRAMWQMEEAGWFRYVKGFLIGRPLVYGQQMMGLDVYEAVLAVARKYEVPVVMDVDLGHLPPMMPVICGSVGRVSLNGNEIHMEFVLKE